jgi:hypothetical protein
MHSMAVDFNKTGIPAEMPRELTVRSFPDFMDRSWGSYPSKKVNTLTPVLSTRLMIFHWHESIVRRYWASSIVRSVWMQS